MIEELMTLRVSPEPRASLPFGVRSEGYIVENGVFRPHRGDIRNHFLWCVRGEGRSWQGKKSYPIRAGDVWIFTKTALAHYELCGEPYEFHWMTLDGPSAPAVLKGFGFSSIPRHAGKYPKHLFEMLRRALSEPEEFGEYRASLIAYDILMRAGSSIQHIEQMTRGDMGDAIRDYIDENAHLPTLGIDQIADHFKKHRATITRIFSECFNMSPGKYLHDLRLHRSMEMLTMTNFEISQIAHRCGFSTPDYFSRAFQSAMGMSPTQYRHHSHSG